VATEEKKRENKEFIVVGVNEDAPLLNGAEAGHSFRPELPARIVEAHTDLLRSEAPAAQALSRDPLEQLQPRGTDQFGSTLLGDLSAEGHARGDHPDAGLVKRPLDGDGELG